MRRLHGNFEWKDSQLLYLPCYGGGWKNVITIEGMTDAQGNLHPIQKAFIEYGAVQCGYCTPGMVLSAKALLDENPKPTEEEIRKRDCRKLCRCTVSPNHSGHQGSERKFYRMFFRFL